MQNNVEQNGLMLYDWFHMETNRLRQFCVVVETNNLRKAAVLLHVSHSAISKSLATLQTELGFTLFVRDGRGLALTDAALAFYPKAKTFLTQEAVLLSKNVASQSVVRLGTFEVFSTHLLGSVWRHYFADTKLELHELLPGHLEQALLAGKIDMGLTYEPIPTAGIEFVRMGKVAMGVFAHASLAKENFSSLPFVAPITPIVGTPSGVRGLDGWPDDKIQRFIHYHVDAMESGLALARAGLAAMFIPHFVARFHNAAVKAEFQLQQVHTPAKMETVWRDVFLVQRLSTVESKVFRRLAKLVRIECIRNGG